MSVPFFFSCCPVAGWLPHIEVPSYRPRPHQRDGVIIEEALLVMQLAEVNQEEDVDTWPRPYHCTQARPMRSTRPLLLFI